MMLILLVSVLAATLNSVLLHKSPKKKNVYTLNLISSAVWVVILLAVNKGLVKFTIGTVFWGILYGMIQLCFLIFKAGAMSSGPVSLTTLIGNCSLVLSTLVSIVFWKEKISAVQIICIFLLILAFFLCTYSSANKSSSNGWIFNCVLFFVFAAGVGIVFKAFSKSDTSGNTADMMIIAAITMFIVLSIRQLWLGVKEKKKKSLVSAISENKTFLIIAIACGALSCIYNRLNITLAGALPGAVFYPCFNGGVILLSSLFGIIFLKERLNIRQGIGILIGLISVVVIGII